MLACTEPEGLDSSSIIFSYFIKSSRSNLKESTSRVVMIALYSIKNDSRTERLETNQQDLNGI